MEKMFGLLVAACSLLGNFAAPSVATAANLVTDGGFANFSSGTSDQFLTTSPTSGYAQLADWSYAGGRVAAVYKSGSAVSTGAQQGSVTVYLWGIGSPNGGSANGFDGTSPDGGNILASDGDSGLNFTFSQTVSGLSAGQTYTLSFNYAAAQFENSQGSLWAGASDEIWHVSLGGSNYSTPKLSIASHGFSGWHTASFSYTALSSSPVTLSFLAESTASGLPPVALLNNVQLDVASVPEPTSLSLVVIGALVGAGYVRNRRKAVIA